MTDLPERLDSDLEAALRIERERRAPGAGVRARVLRRVQTSLAGGAPPSDGAHTEQPVDRGAETPSAESANPVAETIWNALKRAHPALVGGGGFALGVVAGVALHAAATSPPLPKPASLTTASSQAVPAPAPNPPLPAPVAALPEATANATKLPVRPSAAPSDDQLGKLDRTTLAGERALLDLAHAALGRGDTTTALDALTRHARRFPRGTYREEREALRIQCLRTMGKLEEARRAAENFSARDPKSLFRSNVDRALDANR